MRRLLGAIRSVGPVRGLGLLLVLLSILFVVADHLGIFDRLRGINTLKEVSARFNLSYALGASKPVRRGDPEWNDVIYLVERYSHVDFPLGKKPEVFAREQAVFSVQSNGNEWTVPTTRLLLLFKPWPQNTGNTVGPEDLRVVGTLADFQNWIYQDQADFRYWTKDVLLALLSFIMAVTLTLTSRAPAGPPGPR